MLLSLAFLYIVLTAMCFAQSAPTADPGPDPATFREPPARYRGWAMWGLDLSGKTTREMVSAGVRKLAQAGYGGVFMVAHNAGGDHLDPEYVRQGKPFFGFTEGGIEYLSEEFFGLYRAALEEAERQGLNVILYDDYYFPTGSVAGQLFMRQPQHMGKRLDLVAKDLTGPARIDAPLPKGHYVGAVLMNTATFERLDVSDGRTPEGRIVFDVPPGPWRVMIFYLDTDAVLHIRNPGIMNYLDGAAVDAFLSLSYDRFYAQFPDRFGRQIKMAFHDEPSMHWLDGRTWTPGFNEGFRRRYGASPMKLYPALWFDIGPDTAAARNALHGYRAELFAAFLGKLDAWCRRHGIELTGHVDQEEVANPVPINGDLMKVFEHQAVPGADDIFWWGRSNRGYKVVTSAAFNYDKPVVMTETYAAYEKIDEAILFKVAMDQFAMGVNFQCPAAGIERSAGNVRQLNAYTGRLSCLLQGGRHVADVAVLYPIASLQACYRFQEPPRRADGWLDSAAEKNAEAAWTYAYTGGVLPEEIDYMDVGEALFFGLRADFTYLHPEVLERRCLVEGGRLMLANTVNREEYRLLIVPGGEVLHAATARKIQEFWEAGGAVLATSRLAYRSAEPGRDREVQDSMGAVFGLSRGQLVRGETAADSTRGWLLNANRAGGRAYFLSKAAPAALDAILRQTVSVRDVEFQEPMWPLRQGRSYGGPLSYEHQPGILAPATTQEPYDGALAYIHKVRAGRDIYFFANSSDRPVDTEVTLRGAHKLSIWDPHAGTTRSVATAPGRGGGEPVTRVRLALAPVSSLFFVEEPR